MPKRQNVKRLVSAAIQGDDSWVEVRKPTVKEAREMAGIGGNESLARIVLGWNWVDDEGGPLPQPKDDPNVFELLTADEITFINDALTGPTKN